MGGSDNSSYSFNLTTGVADAVVYSAAARRHKPHTPGSGYTERDEIQQGGGGAAAGEAVQDQSFASASTVTVDGSFSGSVDWAVVAVEIKPGGMAKRGSSDNEPIASVIPTEFGLKQNYPNPFNPSTSISYDLQQAADMKLIVYNLHGESCPWYNPRRARVPAESPRPAVRVLYS